MRQSYGSRTILVKMIRLLEFVSCRTRQTYRVPGIHYVVLKHIRPIILLVCIIILSISFIPSVNARALIESSGIFSTPSLATFTQQVTNGQADEIRGIYIPEILAARIVQQPDGNSSFISPWENVLTQFSLASKLGSTGLIAHNDLAGKSFALLQPGQLIHLVYGDGHVSTFTVFDVLQYQALDPANSSSSFVNLKNQNVRSSAQLFTEVYNRPGMLIFQTCIEANQNSEWGRLFVIAKPVTK